MTNLLKLVVISGVTLFGSAQAAPGNNLRCVSAEKATRGIRSVIVQETSGQLFGGVGQGIAAVQIDASGTIRLHRIPVKSYYSKPFAINVFNAAGSNTEFFLHVNREGFFDKERISGQLGYGPIRLAVNCSYLK